MEEETLTPERTGSNPIFMGLYLLVIIGAILFPGLYYGFEIKSYSLDAFINLSIYLVPAAFFGLGGLVTSWKKSSIVYAISAAIISLLVLIFVVQMGWLRF